MIEKAVASPHLHCFFVFAYDIKKRYKFPSNNRTRTRSGVFFCGGGLYFLDLGSSSSVISSSWSHLFNLCVAFMMLAIVLFLSPDFLLGWIEQKKWLLPSGYADATSKPLRNMSVFSTGVFSWFLNPYFYNNHICFFMFRFVHACAAK